VLTGFSGLFHLPILREIALWGLAGATTITVAQRLVEVRRQSRKLLASDASDASDATKAADPA
jgi:hypothetical protein